MDDGMRMDEKKTVELWLREFPGFECEYVELEEGAFIMRRIAGGVDVVRSLEHE
jgi:hypothetical protein